ncbi:MAG TPA: hypothetical protein VF003_00670 [Pseudonocardiaceae bacterium]
MEAMGTGIDSKTDIHHRYIAGRYRDGALSDTWTDVTRCAERTFIAYVARCRCGWHGDDHPANPDGYHSCQRELISKHLY